MYMKDLLVLFLSSLLFTQSVFAQVATEENAASSTAAGGAPAAVTARLGNIDVSQPSSASCFSVLLLTSLCLLAGARDCGGLSLYFEFRPGARHCARHGYQTLHRAR